MHTKPVHVPCTLKQAKNSARPRALGTLGLVPRPPVTKDHLTRVLSEVARGVRQRDIAQAVGKSLAHVQKCLETARKDLARETKDFGWLEDRSRSAVMVAQAWLELQARAAPT